MGEAGGAGERAEGRRRSVRRSSVVALSSLRRASVSRKASTGIGDDFGALAGRRSSLAALADEFPLHEAVKAGGEEVVEAVLNGRCSVNRKNPEGLTALHLAVEASRAPLVRLLLDRGANPNVPGAFKMTALHLACALGELPVVDLLVSGGAELNARDQDGSTPLHWASSSGHRHVIRELLHFSVDLFEKNGNDKTALDLAPDAKTRAILSGAMNELDVFELVATGNIAMLRRLLDSKHCTPDTAEPEEGNCLVHAACFFGQQHVLEYLVLERDSGASQRNRRGELPVHVAALRGHLEPLMFLHSMDEAGVQYALSRAEHTILHLAALGGHRDVVDYILNDIGTDVLEASETGEGAIHLAAKNGHTAVVLQLIEAGGDPEMTDLNGIRPLHMAAANGGLRLIELLVCSHGVDILPRDFQNNLPLHYAARNDNVDALEFLLEHATDGEGGGGCGVDVLGEEGWTPLHFAARDGAARATEFLVNRGADMRLADSSGACPIHLAAENGHTEVVEILVRRGMDPSAASHSRFNPLHLAAQRGHLATVRFLLYVTVDSNAPGPFGNTALHLSALNGHTRVVETLLAAQADSHAINEEENTPLHLACKGKNLPLVEALVADKAHREGYLNAQNAYGRTCLHHAAQYSSPEVVLFLLEHGASIEVTDDMDNTFLHFVSHGGNIPVLKPSFRHCRGSLNQGNSKLHTPLHVAAVHGHSLLCRRLLGCGARLDLEDELGHTALHGAALRGHCAAIEVLVMHATRYGEEPNAADLSEESIIRRVGRRILERREFSIYHMTYQLKQQLKYVNRRDALQGYSAYHHAIESGCLEAVRFVDDHMGDADQKDTVGNTSLHVAASRGHWKILKYILAQARPKVDLQNEEWRTPLFLAAESGHTACVQILLAHGADPLLSRKDSSHPLHAASLQGHVPCISLLLAQGANMDARTIMGETALHWAVKGGHTEAVKELLNWDAEVELKDNTDSTALHWAADYGYADIVQLLLDAGADVHAQGMWRGALPIHLAARQGHTASVKVLAGRTAHMNRGDLWNQSTALHMAAEGGHTETVEFLLQKGCRLDVVDRFNTTAQDCGTTFDVRELIRQTRVLRVATRHIHGASLHSTFLAWRELAAETKVSRLTDAKETWKLIFSLYSSDERKLYYRMWRQWEIRQRRKLKLEVEGKEWVVDRLRETKIFNELSERTLFALAEAMSVAKFRGGHRIMTQGDMGDNFYVLCQGVCEIQINNKEKGTVTRIKVERGATFGELALLQDVPRAATIVTLSNCMLMSLDKLTFQMSLVRNPSAADSSNRVKESFLAKVSLFSGLEGYSRVLLADLMTRESFLDKENIIEQGDLGDKFFIVEEGEAVASIMLPGMSKPKLVRQYSAGDFFGEIALIEDKPRTATVTAVGYLKCVVMDRARFQQLPASIQESLEDHVKTYSGRGAGAIERKAWIVAHLKKCKVFDNVRDRTLYALAGAMFQLRKGPDEVVFNQGDEGDNFYLILEGNCEVRIQMGDRLKKVPLSKGAFFGELALLHNKPRAGAIVTTSSTVLLGLDRQTFQLSQKSQMEERQNSKIISETFLAGVSIFSDVPSHELVLIADLMYRKEFQANTPIVRQGDMGDCFYIILRGQAFASIEGVGSVRDYEPGGYFGEIALMKSVERQASVVAKTRAVCAVLDKSEFQGLPKSVKQKMEEKLYQYGVLEPEVAEEMVEELKYSFSIVDVDGGGDIDFNELKMAARALGLEPTVQELQAMLRAMDEDGGGTVDLDEFVSAVSKEIRRRCKKEAMEQAFSLFSSEVKETKKARRRREAAGKKLEAHILFSDLKRIAGELNENISEMEMQSMMTLGERNAGGELCMTPQQFLSVVDMIKR